MKENESYYSRVPKTHETYSEWFFIQQCVVKNLESKNHSNLIPSVSVFAKKNCFAY